MLFGECPNCDAALVIDSPDKMPVMDVHKCEECGKYIFTVHSRWDPHSYGEGSYSSIPNAEDFNNA